MKWVVFESGSRAGLSAELFFSQYVEETGCDDVLVMSDSDFTVRDVNVSHENIVRTTDVVGIDTLKFKDAVVFPADELTRQRLHGSIPKEKLIYADVEDWFFKKNKVNEYLINRLPNCIRVPKVFEDVDVCLRPNSLSAGSRGLQLYDNYCVTERIRIANEYVVDVFRSDRDMYLFPRQVILKNGYDRLIKLLPTDGEFAVKVERFILDSFPSNMSLFSGVFHLQIAEDVFGDLWYIESSKRISGTSLVNISRGFNPFMLLTSGELLLDKHLFNENEWYRYEDFLINK